jgi:hypothetical protein
MELDDNVRELVKQNQLQTTILQGILDHLHAMAEHQGAIPLISIAPPSKPQQQAVEYISPLPPLDAVVPARDLLVKKIRKPRKVKK